MSAFQLFAVFFHGAAAGGLDVAEACELAGQVYDYEYRSQNPALAVLALLTGSFLAMALAALFIRVKARFQG